MNTEKYTEIFKLAGMLAKADIPFSWESVLDGYCIAYYKKNVAECVCSVIEYRGTYGNRQNKLELMGLLTNKESQKDSVLGWLTAENVFARIKKHWEENK